MAIIIFYTKVSKSKCLILSLLPQPQQPPYQMYYHQMHAWLDKNLIQVSRDEKWRKPRMTNLPLGLWELLDAIFVTLKLAVQKATASGISLAFVVHNLFWWFGRLFQCWTHSIGQTVNIIEIKFHAIWRSAAILSLVLDFILPGSTLSLIDYIHCLVGLLVFYRCVHIWSHNATILQIWKIMVRTTATP